MSNNSLPDPVGGMGLHPPNRMSQDSQGVGPIQHGPAVTIAYDFVTDYWVFESELMVEYNRRRERQIALSRLWHRLSRLVHPELVNQVRVIHERRRVRAFFRAVVVPLHQHELALRNMETFVNNRYYERRDESDQSLRPPVLRRQAAGSGPYYNGPTSPRDSQLGSSHGEITESDDLAAVNSFHARKRREAESNKHSTCPGSAHTSTNGLLAVNVGLDVSPPFMGPEAKSEITVYRYIVRSPVTDPVYTGDGKVHFVGERPGEYKFIDPTGETAHVHEFGDGWFTLSSEMEKNTKPFVVEPSTRVFTLPGYRAKDPNGVMVHYEPREFVIYSPFMKKAEFFLAASETDDALRKAVNALRVKMSVDERADPVMISTAQAFLARCHYLTAMSDDNETAQRCRGSGAVGAYEDGRTAVVSVLGIDQDFKCSRKVLDKPCTMVNDWPIRQDIEVVRSDGVFGSDGNLIEQGPLTTHPRFMNGPQRRTGRFSTHYFELNAPLLSGFVQYDNSDGSLECGLKRLLGAREDELFLRENSLRLGSAITKELAGRNLTCVSVGARCRDIPDLMWHEDVVRVGEKLNAGRRCGPAHGDQAKVHDFVASCVAETVSHCDRTRIQKFIDGLLRASHWAYYAVFFSFLTLFRAFMSREACSQIPHVKQKLRIRYVKRHQFSTHELMVGKNCVIKINTKRETAKDGKAPRLTADYEAGCMYSNELPEYVKVCLHGEEFFQIGEFTLVVFIMSKPKSDSLEQAFARLDQYWHSSKVIYGVVYSDDMCVSGMGEAYNVDISSCDSGQDVPAFMAAYGSMRRFHSNHAEGLLDQCMLPMDIRGDDFHNRLRIQFKGPFLGSGTVLTTLLNHYASLMILCAALFRVSTGSTLQEAVVQGAKDIGHLVTVDPVEVLEDFQFLKRSCTKLPDVTGCLGKISYKYVVFVNRACMLRNLGKVWETIQPRHLGIGKPEFDTLTINQRCDKFFSAVIKGWVHEPSCPIIDALRERFSSEVISGFEVKHDSLTFVFTEYSDYSSYNVSAGCIARYRLTTSQVDELVSKIRNLQLGHVAVASALTSIYEKDYGCGRFNFDETDHRVGRSFEIEQRTQWSV